jgi:hypothetical protein
MEWTKEDEAELMRDWALIVRRIIKGIIDTDTGEHVIDQEGKIALDKIPLEVWEHIGIDGITLVQIIRDQRAAQEGSESIAQ